ncbi:hypothetical protein MKEN_01289500 [Mycena kentingensis (nom. inval.)]|nr:hypothetical protein MKEN_01289500 [Mycena kentingensis (nom. inval.)]
MILPRSLLQLKFRPRNTQPRPGLKLVNHPVPSSSDEGTTLDWSGLGSEDDKHERRWTMSISGKRKDKEKQPSDMAVETRESMHAAKLLQIRTNASPRALEKAATTQDQLGRRYNLVYNSLAGEAFNPAKVVRWFSGQEDIIKSSLEQAEPFVWLRDFQRSRKQQQKSRSLWNLSALIMEEYLQHLRGTSRQPFHNRIASLNSSPSLALASPQLFPSPHGSSYFVLGPSVGRKPSPEVAVPLDPPIDLSRKSIDRESHRSAESGYSSLLSLPQALASPTSPHFHRRVESDNASSLSEHSDDGGRKKRHVPAPLGRDFALSGPSRRTAELRPTLSPIPDDRRFDSPLSSSMERMPLDLPPTATMRSFSQPKVRISLPSQEDFRLHLEKKRQREADEEAAHREYEMKQQLLEATLAQNTRIRLLLNHIAAGVREYDQVQTSLSHTLKLPYRSLPRELVEAFSHDPAAVTGATRKYQGWRAVDDIHHRLARQREIFREYLTRDAPNGSSLPDSALEDPIGALSATLKTLEEERRDITWRATEVSDVLKKVQAVHSQVKTAYNGTLSHTSVIYPEANLDYRRPEESYKYQYQYLWDFAMDLLTFALDTVTPFWRTYGKAIGDDIQQFLIIPLYRNEFTGEAKRYPIHKFPRRSLRHWVFLFSFFLASVAVAYFQTRTAIFSLFNFWLLGIPYPYLRLFLLIPFWISILLQWLAVGIELAVVLTQLAVVIWWIGWSVNIFS